MPQYAFCSRFLFKLLSLFLSILSVIREIKFVLGKYYNHSLCHYIFLSKHMADGINEWINEILAHLILFVCVSLRTANNILKNKIDKWEQYIKT